MNATKTLPASWYCSQNLFDLEKRAVFERSWYLLGPTVRFVTEQDVEYELAGVNVNVHHHDDETFEITRTSDVGF